MNLRCIVADDEPIARQILERYLQGVPGLTLIASCKDAFEVLEVLDKEEVDLLFLDINMPKLSGLSLLKTMKIRPEVIITTAYPEHALEGFELDVVDYLVKPFAFERFFQAVQKVNKRSIPTKQQIRVEGEKKANAIFVKSDKKLVKVYFDEIQYVEAYGNYVKIHTTTRILVPMTLTEFLTKLPDNFIRIHKSTLLNFDKLTLLDGNQVSLENGEKLVVGKSYRKALLARIDKELG
jgi:DNA-binding LytR/AlgR family response regulator